jgi:hypothetical protein
VDVTASAPATTQHREHAPCRADMRGGEQREGQDAGRRECSEGEPRLRGGPRAGDRLPDTRLASHGRPLWLQQTVVGPRLTLLLCGDVEPWDAGRLATLRARWPDLLTVRHLARHAAPAAPDTLVDEGGNALALLGVNDAAQYLVRPDGHVSFRCAGRDLAALERHLGAWFPPPITEG